MSIYRDGKILQKWFSSEELLIEIRTSSLEKDMKYHDDNNLQGLVIKNSIYFQNKSLDFLKNHTQIKKIVLDLKKVDDLSALKLMQNLEGLNIQDHSGVLDFSCFKNSLKEILIYWANKKYKNFRLLKELTHLTIHGDNDLVLYPENLVELNILYSKRESLNCFQGLTKLKRLYIYSLKKLVDISGLGCLENSIEYLTIDKCDNIESFEPIFKLKRLKHLGVITKSKKDAEYLKEKLRDRKDLCLIVHIS